MVMTHERVKTLTDYLTEDMERTKELVNLSAEDALAKINADGYDFTIDEIKEAAQNLITAMKLVSEKNELDTSVLDQVSGGGSNFYLQCASTVLLWCGNACLYGALVAVGGW